MATPIPPHSLCKKTTPGEHQLLPRTEHHPSDHCWKVCIWGAASCKGECQEGGDWSNEEGNHYLYMHRKSILVSWKCAHGWSTLQICQKVEWLVSVTTFIAHFMFTVGAELFKSLKATIGCTTEATVASKSNPNGTQHSEWHHVTVNMQCSSRIAPY